MPAKTIDEVIQQLDDIIDRAYSQKSCLGYFAALYRKVTLKLKEGIGGEKGTIPQIIDILR